MAQKKTRADDKYRQLGPICVPISGGRLLDGVHGFTRRQCRRAEPVTAWLPTPHPTLTREPTRARTPLPAD